MKIMDNFTTYRGLPKEIYILFFARTINCMGSFILPLLALILTQKLGMSKLEAGNFTSFLMMTQAPCFFIGGKLIDTIGRRNVLVICQVLGSISFLACAFFMAHTSMLYFIIIASDLYVMASPAYQAIIADLTTSENRKASFSLLYLGINIGMAISPIFGGFLFNRHLQILFILDASTTLISSLLIALFVKESCLRPSKTSDVTERENSGCASVFRILKGAPILTLFMLLMFTYDFSYAQWSFILPIQFGEIYGTNGARFYSYLGILNCIIVITFTPLLTRLTLKHQPLMVVCIGGLLYFTAFIFFSFVKIVPLFGLAAAIFTFGEITVTINIGTFIADHSPRTYLGRISSIFLFLQGTARALGPLIMGRVLNATNYFTSWLFIAGFVLAGTAGMLFLSRKEYAQINAPDLPV